jgi:hypothetical protein
VSKLSFGGRVEAGRLHLGRRRGRKAGSAPGFRYSRAMNGAAVVWDDKSLDAYLASPEKFIPGNVMAFSGLSEATDRANLIAYLNTPEYRAKCARFMSHDGRATARVVKGNAFEDSRRQAPLYRQRPHHRRS